MSRSARHAIFPKTITREPSVKASHAQLRKYTRTSHSRIPRGGIGRSRGQNHEIIKPAPFGRIASRGSRSSIPADTSPAAEETPPRQGPRAHREAAVFAYIPPSIREDVISIPRPQSALALSRLGTFPFRDREYISRSLSLSVSCLYRTKTPVRQKSYPLVLPVAYMDLSTGTLCSRESHARTHAHR